MPFANRVDAGRRLAERLRHLEGQDVVVLGLPRGGVPVAFEVAEALHAPLDVIVVRKLGVPFQPELGMGAIGEEGVRIVNDEIVRLAGVDERAFAAVEARERVELDRRAARYRAGRSRVSLAGRIALIVDDGIATGSTARAACQVARAHGAARVVLAAPVAPPSTIVELRRDADEVVCVETPAAMSAIGFWYDDFSQTRDDEVSALLERAAAGRTALDAEQPSASGDPAGVDADVDIDLGPLHLEGHLTIPDGASAVVVFAHGSGSSRHSPRNRYVAAFLNRAGFGTLLFDLLTSAEEVDRANVFDIGLLAGRLGAVTAWLRRQPRASGARIGYFGASTGAGAALWAAAEPGADIAAVVSRGGRPDLAGPRLGDVLAPTLLIVGGRDVQVLELNEWARARLRCASRLAVVPGATHLFEEPGTLEAAAELAREWFATNLASTPQPVR